MRSFYGLVFLLLLAATSRGQSNCPPLQTPAVDPSKLLFSAGQEEELGQILRQQTESEFRVIQEDPTLLYLRRVGDRVVRQLPDIGLHYEFVLYDQPEIQAFSMPGGRIYVSRKMVAFLRNEDELAGLLGHELGHLVARQQAMDLSFEFREVLGLKSVAPDEDLLALYNRLVDSVRMRRNHSAPSSNEDKNQKVADLLGVRAVARAGYSPQAFPDLLDRLMVTKGKTGNWFSDLFGATSQDSKRLREALKDVGTLPASCVETRTPSKSGEFEQWQESVLRYRGIGHLERLSGVLSRKQLSNPLRGDIEHFRFSPDGKYILAQDDGGIYLVSRDPLKFVFRIDAVDAHPAQFSPDSRQIEFFSSSLRVETWDIDRQEQVSIKDIPALHGCRQSALSPDAKYFACFSEDFELILYNVSTGDPIFKKEKFYDFDSGINGYEGLFKLLDFLIHPDVVTLRFSPDSRYFAASSRTKEEVVIDLSNEKKISVSGAVRTAMEYSFTFLGPNRIVGVDAFKPQNSPVVEFPTGKVLDHAALGGRSLIAATDPGFVLVRPAGESAVGGFSLDQKKYAFSNRMAATDVWNGIVVSERLNGEIGLYKLPDFKTPSTVQLPMGKLGALRTFLASPDLKWVALSGKTRGGVWNIDSTERAFYVRSFQNAYYAPDSTFYLDFPEIEKAGREIAVLRPSTKQSKSRPVEKDDKITLFGSTLLRTKRNQKGQDSRNFSLEALDLVTLQPLWTRNFPKQGPEVTGPTSDGKLVFTWNARADGLREELARDPNIQNLWNKENPKDTDVFLEVINEKDGSVFGGAVVRTGKNSFFPEQKNSAGDWLVITDNRNRVLLYSKSTGQQKAKWFGYRPQISKKGDRLCLANGRGRLIVYDLHTLKESMELLFLNSVSAFNFSEDGNRLLALTDDQTVFVIDVTAGLPATSFTK
jgi:WD40 repeat protein